MIELPEKVQKALDDPGFGGTWDNCVIEFFEPEAGWPKEGTPADWIFDHKVVFGMGWEEDFVVPIPLWKIMWWKFECFANHAYWTVRYYVWDKWHPIDWEEFKKEHNIKVIDDKGSPGLD